MAVNCSILAWRIPWTEEPRALPPMESNMSKRLALTGLCSFLSHRKATQLYMYILFHVLSIMFQDVEYSSSCSTVGP